MMSNKNKKFIWVFAFAVAGAFGVEFASVLALKAKKIEPLPFLYSANKKARTLTPANGLFEYSLIDAQLGYSVDPLFTRYGEENDQEFRLITLGGSTTDPTFEPHNWSKYLKAKADSQGVRGIVFNGGVGGYSSAQATWKLLRDGLPLNPTNVVSLDGVNDIGVYFDKENPMVHPYQSDTYFRLISPWAFEARLFPNTAHLLLRLKEKIRPSQFAVRVGHVYQEKAVETWEKDIRLMRALSEQAGARYLAVLQPLLGYGKYEMNEAEKVMLEEADLSWNGTYIDTVQAYYTEASKRCAKLSFCVDLTDVFDGKANMYKDARHQTPQGYQHIGETIYATLRTRGLLAPARGTRDVSNL